MDGEKFLHISPAPWRMAPTISWTGLYVIAALLIAILVLQTVHAYVTTEDKSRVAPESLDSSATFIGQIGTTILYQLGLGHLYISPKALSTIWLHRGFLERLAPRKGCRPIIASTLSRGRHTQLAPIEVSSALSSTIRSIATTYPQLTYLGRSTFETHGNKTNTAALFSRRRTYGETKYLGEICRLHPEGGSMHLKLHPADVKTVIESGWGERHPRAMSRWWWKYFTGVPTGCTLIYAPRDEQELMVVTEIIRAAVWWVGKMDSESWS